MVQNLRREGGSVQIYGVFIVLERMVQDLLHSRVFLSGHARSFRVEVNSQLRPFSSMVSSRLATTTNGSDNPGVSLLSLMPGLRLRVSRIPPFWALLQSLAAQTSFKL
ncbi:hypothetical protein Nepgr_032008 [Nepenthes gracilis]|uniref:Uncharacterized protein n=1 Tax=Nepenthes gracilis TaxID=150966 RepID=A0AAD3Y7C2_NEPGR|nr:hypothetical protein Nepgr_032008 [Nepenthes gracilis]